MAPRLAWPIASWALLALVASASIVRGPRSPAESATGRFFLAPHPEQKLYHHHGMNEIQAAKEDKEHEASGDEPPAQVPGTNWLGLGALSNMQKFFDVLRDNLEIIDDEGAYVEPKNDLMMATEPYADQPSPSFNRRPIQESSAFRPSATAAYLHALRNHKPSTKMRSFVGHVEPSNLRGSNTYDPAWLWAGLGRRRR